jgi:hypothetical protein
MIISLSIWRENDGLPSPLRVVGMVVVVSKISKPHHGAVG